MNHHCCHKNSNSDEIKMSLDEHTNHNEVTIKRYYCPMHPEVTSDKPGSCSECGMNLVLKKDKKTHSGHSTEMFVKKFWVSLVLTIPILAYSELPKSIFDFKFPDFAGKEYLSLILGSVIFFYGGWVFIVGALPEIRGKMPGMMTLIGFAGSAAY